MNKHSKSSNVTPIRNRNHIKETNIDHLKNKFNSNYDLEAIKD